MNLNNKILLVLFIVAIAFVVYSSFNWFMAKNKKKRSLTLVLRNYFITGVVVLIPIGFTLYLSKILIGVSSKIIPENINPNNYLPYAIHGI